jgi:hypothetical protein
MAMQIPPCFSLQLGSSRNILHLPKTAFKEVSSGTGIGGFIKSIARKQIHPEACNSFLLAVEKDMDVKEFLNLQEFSL